MRARPATIAIVCLVLTLAVALKVVRYSEALEEPREATASRVAQFLAKHEWRPLSGGDGALAGGVQYRKPGCAAPIEVSILEGNAESAEFIRLNAPQDAIFFQGGHFVKRPSGLRRQLAMARHLGLVFIGHRGLRPLPVLALYPVPSETEETCLGPSQRAWQAITAIE